VVVVVVDVKSSVNYKYQYPSQVSLWFVRHAGPLVDINIPGCGCKKGELGACT